MIFIKIGNYNVALKNIVYIRFTEDFFVIQFKDSSRLSLKRDNYDNVQKIQEIIDIFKLQNVEFIRIDVFYIVKNCIKDVSVKTVRNFLLPPGCSKIQIYFKNDRLNYISTPLFMKSVVDKYIKQLNI